MKTHTIRADIRGKIRCEWTLLNRASLKAFLRGKFGLRGVSRPKYWTEIIERGTSFFPIFILYNDKQKGFRCP